MKSRLVEIVANIVRGALRILVQGAKVALVEKLEEKPQENEDAPPGGSVGVAPLLAVADGGRGDEEQGGWRDSYPESIREPHSAFKAGGWDWKLTEQGVVIITPSGDWLPRSVGYPLTVQNIMRTYGGSIEKWCGVYGVPREVVVATMATENRITDRLARREEPGYRSDEETPNRVSVGLMQTLISTAREALSKPTIDADWLSVADNSIWAGVAYIRQQSALTGFDPPLVAAAYNAGGVYRENHPNNRWQLKCYPLRTGRHVTRFVMFFNDLIFTQNHTAKDLWALWRV